MIKIADRLSTIEESQTIGMAKKTRELQAKGISVIPLHFGEPDFDTPEHIKNAAIEAIRQGKTKYTPVAGLAELREAISEKFQRENQLSYAPDQIVVSSGAKHALMNVIMCTINPGDEVMLPTPYWVSYSEMIKFAGGVPVYIPSSIQHEFKPDWEVVKNLLSHKTKMFLFSSPNNPTGNIYRYEDLSVLSEILAEYPDVLVVADEIYEHIMFGTHKHVSIGSFESLKNRVVTVNGVSKAFAMTGWRIGYIGAPKEIAQACEKLQSQFTSGANSIAQYAALSALQSDLSPTKAMRNAFEERRNVIIHRLEEMPGIICNHPEGAFYVFPDVSQYFNSQYNQIIIKDSYDFCMYMLEEAHISMVSGSAFGNDNCVRISYATSLEQINLAADRMKAALSKLK